VERQPHPLSQALRSVQQEAGALDGNPALQQVEQQGSEQTWELDAQGTTWMRSANDLRQRLVLAELLLEAALFRQESRGGHFRLDAPLTQPFWCRHTLQQRCQQISTEPVGC
jgi:L-aspartate oxidase